MKRKRARIEKILEEESLITNLAKDNEQIKYIFYKNISIND